ncbi:MAG: MFS transporter [Magnetococcales bacterium]|nr:MFS transporter [Magnetococcales bacterium]
MEKHSVSTLPATVWLLGLISLVNDAAGELVYPLVPLYLSSVLMAGPRAMGLIEGIAEMASSLFKLFSGVMADRYRASRWMVTVGYGMAALARPLLAFANGWGFVLAMRFVDRLGKGLRSSPRDAMIAAVVPVERRGMAFGLQRAMDNLGSVIGPLLAAWMLASGMPLREAFLWAIVPGVVTIVLALMIREPERPLVVDAKPFSWDVRRFPAAYRRYLMILALFTLGNSSNMFLLLRAREVGVPEYQVPLLWGVVSLVAALFATHLSALSDRWGRLRLIRVGWMVYAAFYLLLGWNAVTWLLWPLFAFYGLFMAATEGAEKALVADLAPPEQLGVAYGWFHLVSGLMLLPASLLFGWLWQSLQPEFAFGWAAACACAASLLIGTVTLPAPGRQ